MSNKKKTNEAEQRAIAEQEAAKKAQAEADQVRKDAAAKAEETIKLTPQAQQALESAGNIHSAYQAGNLKNGIPLVTSFLTNTANQRDAAKRSSPTGLAGLVDNVANPNLLAMNEQKLDAQAANATAAGVSELAYQADRDAMSDIMNLSGMDLSAKTGLVNFMFQNSGQALQSAGLSNTLSQTAWDRYKFEKSQKPFWQSAVLAGIGAGGQAAGAYFGKG